MADKKRAGSPDDLRALGWSVAVHNDYRLNGVRHTFWLMTRGDRCVKGEGLTDADALNVIRAALDAPELGCVTCGGSRQITVHDFDGYSATTSGCPDCKGTGRQDR